MFSISSNLEIHFQRDMLYSERSNSYLKQNIRVMAPPTHLGVSSYLPIVFFISLVLFLLYFIILKLSRLMYTLVFGSILNDLQKIFDPDDGLNNNRTSDERNFNTI